MNHLCRDVDSFVEQLPVGIIVLDSSLRIQTCNDLALRLLDVAIENCLLANFPDAVGDARLKDALRLAQEGTAQQHIVLESPDRVIACAISTVSAGAGGNEVIIIAEDATHLRGIERMKREFIGSLLHRIRNPLATLKTSLAMVQDERMGALPPDVREVLGMGYHEVNRLTVLLNDMRDLFLIETGLACKDLVTETFAVSEVLDRTVADLTKMGPPLNAVHGRLIPSGNVDAKIAADFEKTKRIFMNLLKNALLYSVPDGPVEFSCINAEGNANIRVQDRGPGIAREKMPLVFTKFFREDTPYTRKYEGNGLGLFIAKSFTELMDGSMYCESEQGKGSSFFLTLPSPGLA
jgi:signal transduction histidine kinase